jgi:hypothetical protein
MKKISLLIALFSIFSYANSCSVPAFVKPYVVKSGLKALSAYSDVRRNYNSLKGLCVNLIAFKEGRYNWKMLLVFNPNAPKGAFWFLPHDNENSAFSSAVYATRKYGGGFLAVQTGGSRYFKGQDPNRNFSDSNHRVCSQQKAASAIYTSTVFGIIDSFRSANFPYLALHNNTNRGGISILKNSNSTKSYLAYSLKSVKSGQGLADEDSLVYTAGTGINPPANKVNVLLRAGLNIKYEIVNSSNNDCSMSNYVVLGRGSNNYYNIEAQHGKTSTQIEMINRLMKIIQ